jgi:hypothetical protein
MERQNALDLVQAKLDKAVLPEERDRLYAIAANLESGWNIRKDALESLTVSCAPNASMQSWRECLYSVIADGTAVTAAARTILVPDFTLPAYYLYPGRTLKYTLMGRMSSVITTPGTFVWSLMWGGAAGVVLAASAAVAPDPAAASSNVAWAVQFYVVCRSIGATGTAMTMGILQHNDMQATAAELNKLTISDVPAVATIDTTTAKAISPTITPSLTTGSVQAHIAVLESIS